MNLTTTYTNPIFEMIGYEPKTTFWTDFSIADMFGTEGVQDTYNRAKESWQDNIEYMAEFAMVLNHKSWQHNGKNQTLCSLYADLWCNIEDFIYEHFKDNEEAISYYQRVTDQIESNTKRGEQPLLKIIAPHKTIIKILYNERRRNTTVQKHDTVTQKDNKHTRKRGKDTPKCSNLTQKNAREQGSKLLKENGLEYFRKRSEKACKRGQAEKKKNSSSAEIRKNSARAKK